MSVTLSRNEQRNADAAAAREIADTLAAPYGLQLKVNLLYTFSRIGKGMTVLASVGRPFDVPRTEGDLIRYAARISAALESWERNPDVVKHDANK